MTAAPAESLPLPPGCVLDARMAEVGKVRRRWDKRARKWRYYLDFRDGAERWPELAEDRHRFLWSDGGTPWKSPGAAGHVLSIIRRKIQEGVPAAVAIDEHRRAQAERYLVTAQVESWLARVAVQHERGQISYYTATVYRSQARKHFGWWGNRFMRRVDTASLEQWVADMESRGYAPKTIRGVLRTFAGFLRWYQRTENPAFVVPPLPRVKVERKNPKVLTLEQQSRVLEAIPEPHRGIFLAMCRFALRPGEARALSGADWDREAGTIHVWRACKTRGRKSPIGPTKTGATMHYRVPVDLAAWLGARPRPIRGAPLFPHPSGNRYGHADLLELWNAAVAEAHVPPVKLYKGVRHTTLTAMLPLVSAGKLSLWDLKLFARHGSIQTTERFYLDWQAPSGVASVSEGLAGLLVGPGKEREVCE